MNKLHRRSGAVLLLGLGLLAGCVSPGPEELDSQSLETGHQEEISTVHRNVEPPTDWIDRPIATQCAACEALAQKVREVQGDAEQARGKLSDSGITQGYREQVWRDLWAHKQRYERALENLRACEQENCPPNAAQAIDDEPGDESAGFFYIPGTDVRLRLGYGEVDMPQTGFGTVIGPDGEHFLGETDDELSGYGFAFDLAFSNATLEEKLEWLSSSWLPPDVDGDWDHGLRVGFNYFSADGDDSFEEPIGGNAVAFTYLNLDSPGGATGVNFGDTGMSLETDVDYTAYGLSLGMDVSRRLGDLTRLRFHPHVRLQRREYEYDGMAQSLTFTDSFMDISQDVDETRFGLGIDGRLIRDFGGEPSQGFYGLLGGRLGLDYGHADLDSSQFINVPVNPNPSDRMFTVDVDDQDDYASFNLGAEVGVGYAKGGWTAELVGGIDWTSDVPEVNNPASPNESATDLGTTDQASTRLMFNVGYRF